MGKNKNRLILRNKTLFLLPVLLIFTFLLVIFVLPVISERSFLQDRNILSSREKEMADIKRFASAEDFEKYLTEAMEMAEDYYGLGVFSRDLPIMETDLDLMAPSAEAIPERYSETNVQVEGVDEPDIVKTDGMNIYASMETPYYRTPIIEPTPIIMESERSEVFSDHLMPWPRYEQKTKIIKAFPVAELDLISEIEKSGKLLLKDDTLVIFEADKIFGYDIKDKKNPEKKWEIGLNQRTQLAGARLYRDTVYLIVFNRIQSHRPCVIEPLTINDSPLRVECTSVYHPRAIVPVDTTYTVLAIDLKSGESKQEVSFIGSQSNSVIYVSPDNIYISYYRQQPIHEIFTDFFKQECRDIIPADVIKKLEKLGEYDISSRAKMVEFEIILEEWMSSLDSDEELKVETELINRMPEYYKSRMREMETTGIIKIGMPDLKIKASGTFPGSLLNQFAMDEYGGNLRVATTVGERNRFIFSLPRTAGIVTANDIYVLDGNLERIGSVKDLGLEERIYSARFIGDMGYVVTFREIDPFYVLDLSDPHNPEMKGELKIPGYSSYLHPVGKDRILGIGREDWNVKISLFDVSDPYNPREIDKYFLSEYWSEILNNHHAFLLDSKYEIFFLPGDKGAYIFSFSDDKINLVRTLKEARVKRALYIDDSLYIVSEQKVTVLDQKSWETVKELNF